MSEFVEKRKRSRRAADRNFWFTLVAGAVMLSLTMFSLGYWYAAGEAAGIVIGAR
jgi:predicted phage tail protein